MIAFSWRAHPLAPFGTVRQAEPCSSWDKESRYAAGVLDLDQIAAAAEWARMLAVGGSRSGPYATFFVWLLFLYDYDAHRRCGAADQFPQHFNDSKWA